MGQIIPGGWTVEQSLALERYVGDGDSYSVAAAKINEEYGTNFSRNAAIGRANRIGLSAPIKPPQPRKPRVYKPKDRTLTRIVRANGNSNAMRIVTLSERTEFKLRCVEIEPLNKTLIELKKGDCRQPYGDGPFTFCGHPARAGSSYCTPHHHLNWEPRRILTDKAPVREVA